MHIDSLSPFLKWPGGKRWAAPIIASVVQRYLRGTYFEPFVGGGAVFFHLRPRSAVLGDLNADLVATYTVVRDHPNNLVCALQSLPVSAEQYYKLRAAQPRTPFRRAVRFLYLNRTAFGGLYRENRSGQFNVPYGGGSRRPDTLWRTPLLKNASKALKSAELYDHDFEHLIVQARRGDAIYCDPCYAMPSTGEAIFYRYNGHRFSWEDQRRLASAVKAAVRRGVTVLVSTPDSKAVRDLYRGADVRLLRRFSSLSANPAARRVVKERLLVMPGSSRYRL